MERHEHDHLDVKRMVLSVLENCSHCHEPHAIDDFRIVGRNGNLWVLTIRCAHCAARAYVAAVVGDYGVDIAETEAADWAGKAAMNAAVPEPVTVDDVLDIHDFLETFDGDFQALFTRRRR